MSDWKPLLRQISNRPAAVPGEGAELSRRLGDVDLTDTDTDGHIAQAWRVAAPVVRAQVLKPALLHKQPGLALCAELVGSITALDHVSANAAIAVLIELQTPPLSAEQWRQVGLNVVSQRDQPIPDVESAMLLAKHGPPDSSATVALCAFRNGPEDAEDREAAIVAMGRHGRVAAGDWLHRIAGSGVLGLAVVSGVAQWLSSGPITASSRRLGLEILRKAAGVDSSSPLFLTDTWLRVGCVDVMAHLDLDAGLALAASVWRAGGADRESWAEDAAASRLIALSRTGTVGAADLEGVVATLTDKGLDIPALPPVATADQRVMARSPRISRRAAVLVQEGAVDAAVGQRALMTRASVEAALVARHQLMASFLVEKDTEPAQLGDDWTPISALLSAQEREGLVAEEDRWLRGEDA